VLQLREQVTAELEKERAGPWKDSLQQMRNLRTYAPQASTQAAG